MSDPTWILDFFASVMLAVSAYCATRLAVVRRLHRTLHGDVNVAHVVMGVAMAGMLAPALNLLGNTAWEVLFAGLAAWFTAKSALFIARHGLRGRSSDHTHGVSHYLTHLVMSCAMLYMYLGGVSITTAHATGMVMAPPAGTADLVALPLFFIVVLAATAVAARRRARPVQPGPGGGRGRRRHDRWARIGRWRRGPALAGPASRDGMSHRRVRGHGVHARADALRAALRSRARQSRQGAIDGERS